MRFWRACAGATRGSWASRWRPRGAHLQPRRCREPLFDLVAQVSRRADSIRTRRHDRAEPHEPRERGAPKKGARCAAARQHLRLRRRSLWEFFQQLLVRGSIIVRPCAVTCSEAERADADAHEAHHRRHGDGRADVGVGGRRCRAAARHGAAVGGLVGEDGRHPQLNLADDHSSLARAAHQPSSSNRNPYDYQQPPRRPQ